MVMNGTKLGEILLDADIITKRQLAQAVQKQVKGDKRKLGEILVEMEYVNVADLTEVMMEQANKAQTETEKSKRDFVLSQQILKSKTKLKPVVPTPVAPTPVAPTPQPIDISEDAVMKTKFALDIKTMISAAVGIASLVGMWYALQADIQEAKELPKIGNIYDQEYPSKPEGYNWPRSYEQYKDNVEGLQDEMDDAYEKLEEMEDLIKELRKEINSLEKRKRDK
jgi:flagellar motility protein MotE (MotC chaperone)